MGEPARHTEGPRRSELASRRLTRALRSTAVVVGTLALLGATGVVPALAAPAQPGLAAVSPDFPVTVTISSVQPPAPTAGDSLQISGTVTNSGSTPLKAAQVGLSLGRGSTPLANRYAIGTMLARTDPASADGKPLAAPVSPVGDLAPGASTAFHLPPVAISDLKLDPSEGSAVYELAVQVQAGTNDDPASHEVGIARSVLPYFSDPKDVPQKTQVATVWPLTHQAELVTQTLDTDQSPVLRDDSLATDLAPNGRLGQLLSLGEQIPSLTWVIDPALLDAVTAMTKPYRVQLPGHSGEPAHSDNTVAGTGTAVATHWLDELRHAVTQKGDEVVALPYGDPDLASIAHNGSGLSGLSTVLGKAQVAGQVTVEGRLMVDPVGDIAWPYQGALDPQTAQVAQQLGGSKIIVSSASVSDPQLSYTPNAARPLPNGQTALVADSTIADLFANDLATPEARSAAEQRFLAETLAMTRQQPSTQRTLLVMPPRNLTAQSAQTLQDALLKSGQWTNPVTLDTVAGTPADPATADTTVQPADAYPAALRAGELPSSNLGQVADVQGQMDLLLQILTNPGRVSSPFSAAMMSSVSTSWRTDAKAGDDYRTNVSKNMGQLVNAVSIPKKSNKITLAGNEGVLQVSVKNDLTQPVINLELRLTSNQPYRVSVSKPQNISLSSAQSVSAKFLAQAQGNGVVQMTAQLYTVGPNPQPYGEPVKFSVEVSQVPNGVWWVVGAGVLLVLLAGLRFFLQRRKRKGEPDDDPDAPLVDPDAPDGAGEALDAEDGPDSRPSAGSGTNPPESDSRPTPEGTAAHP
ncbi:DUF6049 family protein [Kitasatospora sp. NBC_01302]|uniref:DUF6049 family protein n=1 Tax=Kitasatospora sp. NBC_01302 TaxID=2903575 RepID=UPI002E1383B0|nr:DUF6049 family protein [Kitasatospora sp. NBC_01302]